MVNLAERVLAYLNQTPWESWDPIDFAKFSEVPLAVVYQTFPEKEDILRQTIGYINELALTHYNPEDFSTLPDHREAILELLLQRYEAMQPYHQAMYHIWRACQYDLCQGYIHAAEMQKTLEDILQKAGIQPTLVAGKSLYLVYLYGLKAWLSDPDPAMSQTMARLDQALTRWWQFLHYSPV